MINRERPLVELPPRTPGEPGDPYGPHRPDQPDGGLPDPTPRPPPVSEEDPGLPTPGGTTLRGVTARIAVLASNGAPLPTAVVVLTRWTTDDATEALRHNDVVQLGVGDRYVVYYYGVVGAELVVEDVSGAGLARDEDGTPVLSFQTAFVPSGPDGEPGSPDLPVLTHTAHTEPAGEGLAVVTWPPAPAVNGNAVAYHVYLGGVLMAHTRVCGAVFGGVSAQPTTVVVRAVTAGGTVLWAEGSVQSGPSGLVVGGQERAVPTQDLPDAGTATVNLADYVRLYGVEWADVDVDVYATGCEAAASGVSSVDVEASTGLGIVVARIRHTGSRSLWVGFLVEAGGAGISGHIALDPALMTTGPADVSATLPDVPWARPGASDGVPGLELYNGTDGHALRVVCADPQGARFVPLLPAGTTQVMVPETLIGLGDGLNPATTQTIYQWGPPGTGETQAWAPRASRAFTGSALYDVSKTALPAAVHYAAPTHYAGVWLDGDLYPTDARLVIRTAGNGHVAYRGGLESPVADAISTDNGGIVVSNLTVVPSSRTALLTWDTAPVVPLSVKIGSSNVTHGTNGATVHGLSPGTEYTVTVGLDSVTFTTDYEHPEVSAVAEVIATGEWEYTVYVEPGAPMWDEYVVLGTTSTASQLVVTSSTFHAELPVVVTYDGVGSVRLYADVRVSGRVGTPGAPGEEDTALIDLPYPVFYDVVYEGTTVHDGPPNVYDAGRLVARVEGMLPPGLSGSLVDYVTVTLVGPGGEELGETAEVDRPTEIRPRVRITAAGGHTPYVDGVSVTYIPA